jgi:hypothetical protein
MQFRIVLLLALLGAFVSASAQQPAPEQADASVKSAQETITAEFGAGFKLDPKFPPITTDLDADGAPDLVFVSFGKNPLGATIEKEYKVLDPYDSYFGFGNPKVTTKFSDFGDGTSHCVLIIHDYQAPKPKAKFVIVNLPFEKLSLGSTPYKKKTVTGLAALEQGGLNAIVFWDGKKYRWEPTDFSTDTSQLDLSAK